MSYKEVVCPHCGVICEVEHGTTEFTCPHCDEEVKQCSDCGEWFDPDNMTYTATEECVCEDCLCNDYFWCEHCEEYEHIDGANTVKVGYRRTECWCDACVNSCASWCENCDTYAADDYATEVRGGKYVCNDCIEDEYYYCDQCGEYVHSDEWDCDHDCCEDCAPHSRIDSYHAHHGGWRRFGDCLPRWRGLWRGIGIELEIDRDDRDDDEESDLIDELENIAGEHIYFEHDGSLNHGFEIITQPHTVDAFNAIDWKSILSACTSHDYTSHDAGTCGLHVHISREMFGSTEQIADNNIAKLIKFYNDNYEEIVKVSRRTLYSAEQWAAKYDGATDRKGTAEIMKKKYSAGRYHAVNITNSKTVEIRIMRGTLNYNSFMACIDFVVKTAQNARRIKWTDVDNVALWLRGIEDNTREYIEKRGAFKCV